MTWPTLRNQALFCSRKHLPKIMNEKQKLETSNTAGLRNDAHYNANELYLSVKHISISSLC